ncbi:MAG: hypothetical protein IPH80_32025 [Myxococcales bacterium]|nr:hypothetical protein [Myxococcales bacterium]
MRDRIVAVDVVLGAGTRLALPEQVADAQGDVEAADARQVRDDVPRHEPASARTPATRVERAPITWTSVDRWARRSAPAATTARRRRPARRADRHRAVAVLDLGQRAAAERQPAVGVAVAGLEL